MSDTYPERQRTLGSLLRLPYNELQDAVYGALPAHGFHDLRTAHSAVFRHLDPGGTRMTTLAERAGMTKQSMAYLVENLRECGYLKVAADPADGRAKLVQLTRRGMAAMTTLIALSQEFEDWLAEAVGSANVKRLRALLEQVSSALESRRKD
ncbi:MarR family winged helix-turn-helix transcriptional regulator [Rhodanobacter ginsengiterrae]|uniref:MarR family winged helix-turn-helix transcriptional regulator n=1 Tax=Rhodanobacter ginsengiterrae TaxID=2008451 RepID=UPI003CEC4714